MGPSWGRLQAMQSFFRGGHIAPKSHFVEMLSALCDAKAEFLIVGTHAMAVHGRPRDAADVAELEDG